MSRTCAQGTTLPSTPRNRGAQARRKNKWKFRGDKMNEGGSAGGECGQQRQRERWRWQEERIRNTEKSAGRREGSKMERADNNHSSQVEMCQALVSGPMAKARFHCSRSRSCFLLIPGALSDSLQIIFLFFKPLYRPGTRDLRRLSIYASPPAHLLCEGDDSVPSMNGWMIYLVDECALSTGSGPGHGQRAPDTGCLTVILKISTRINFACLSLSTLSIQKCGS